MFLSTYHCTKLYQLCSKLYWSELVFFLKTSYLLTQGCLLHVGNPSSLIQPLDYHQETSLIDWRNHKPRHLLSSYPNEDEQIKRFNTPNFNCSLLHLKTMKVINFDGPLCGKPLVKRMQQC